MFCLDVRDLAKQLGLDRHPLWLEHVAQRAKGRSLQKVLSCILYSLDAHAQFANMRGGKAKLSG